ncbi:MAG: hypothetical protein KF866_06415 [Phycisphaeraceae bacterium]|nr:hypothetical protein [Phycisphaeraceae bacterium]MCW5754628.1 hypothetical protein [Phycisphaeraceae bacterium]
MKRIALFGLIVGASVGAAHADVLYTVNQGNELVAIDPDTLTFTTIGPLGTNFAFGDLAFDAATGTMYMAAGFNNNNLYTVDRATGAATLVGPHGRPWMTGLAFDDSTGTLYGGQAVIAKGFFSIDSGTGASTMLSANSGADLDGLAYDTKRDMVVGAAAGWPGNLFSLDRVTGMATEIYFNPNFIDNGGLAYDAKRDLFWYIGVGGNLFTFDPNDGYQVSLVATGLGWHAGLVWVVPAPGVLAAFALATPCVMRRRR